MFVRDCASDPSGASGECADSASSSGFGREGTASGEGPALSCASDTASEHASSNASGFGREYGGGFGRAAIPSGFGREIDSIAGEC